jgi:hypothetical protein
MSEAVLVPKKLMLIAVDADTGTIREPQGANGSKDAKPRVVGIVDEAVFDDFVAQHLLENPPDPDDPSHPKKARRVTRMASPQEPYGNPPKPAKHVATILDTHNSPGCVVVYINGWPFCY